MSRKLSAADLFCGGGGTSQGAEDSGAARVVFAVNHWPLAIETHSKNFPSARHVCARIDQVSPAECPRIDLLFASPECTHHSRARGGKPVDDQKRAQAWDVLKWAEHHRPSWIVIENVPEFEQWGPVATNGYPLVSGRGRLFEAWVKAVEALGYWVEWRRLNAADFGAATCRSRLFVIARKGRRPVVWPEPTHCRNPDGMLPALQLPRWRAAWEVIDWSRPCPSIFDRPRPLAEKTLLRIEAGLRRFCKADNVEAFIVKLRSHETGHSAEKTLGTITAGGTHHALAVPFLTQFNSGDNRRSQSIEEPLKTVVAGATRHGLVMPFIAQWDNHGGNGAYVQPCDAPVGTLTTKANRGVVMPFLMDVNHGDSGGTNGRTYPADSPLGAVTAHNGRAVVQAILTKYYGTGGAKDPGDPLDTVTAKGRHGLAMVKLIETMQSLSIADIGFRMLHNDELSRATGFPENYFFAGCKADVTRQIGNAVPPPFATAITQAIAAA